MTSRRLCTTPSIERCLLVLALLAPSACGDSETKKGETPDVDASVDETLVDSGAPGEDAAMSDASSVDDVDANEPDANTAPEPESVTIPNASFESVSGDAGEILDPDKAFANYVTRAGGSMAVDVVHLSGSHVSVSSPLSAPADGDNALVVYSQAGIGEGEVRTLPLEQVEYDDEYTFTVALARSLAGAAPTRVSLSVWVGEPTSQQTLLRELVTLGDAGVFEDHTLTFSIPRELHGKNLSVGIHYFSSANASVLVDNLRLSRVRPGTTLPAASDGVVHNHSFESPALVSGDYTQEALLWETSGGYAGVVRHTTAQISSVDPLAEPADGNQVLELERYATAKSQPVTQVIAGKHYRLTVAVRRRDDLFSAEAHAHLWVDDASVASALRDGTATAWSDLDLCWVAGAQDAGKTLRVVLEAGQPLGPSGPYRLLFDNVRLEIADELCVF